MVVPDQATVTFLTTQIEALNLVGGLGGHNTVQMFTSVDILFLLACLIDFVGFMINWSYSTCLVCPFWWDHKKWHSLTLTGTPQLSKNME
jgi:NADH:ubiquinone oxidoreductase subunit K